MVWLVISILVVLVAFIGLGFYENERCDIAWKLNGKQILSLVGLLLLLPGFITKIPANSVGIVYSPFGGTKEETLTEGFHTKNIFDKVYKFSTEVQTKSIGNLTTQTKDAQFLTSILDIKYRVSASNAYLVFKQFRTLDNMSENLIVPTTQRVVEHVTTQYNIIDILGEKRNTIYNELEVALKEEFAQYGIDFVSVTIVDMDAGEKLEAAIEDEAVAKKAVENIEEVYA